MRLKTRLLSGATLALLSAAAVAEDERGGLAATNE